MPISTCMHVQLYMYHVLCQLVDIILRRYYLSIRSHISILPLCLHIKKTPNNNNKQQHKQQHHMRVT